MQSLIISLLLVGFVFFSLFQAVESQLCVRTSNPGNCVNLRALPSLNGRILRCLRNGTQVEDLAELVSADGFLWRQIRHENLTGWSADRFLRNCGPVPPPPPHQPTVLEQLPFVGDFPISQFFGDTRTARFFDGTFYDPSQGMHTGIDWSMPHNTTLYAVCRGDVVHAGNFSPFGAGPRSVILRCGQHYILYGHVGSELVEIGQNVSVGQPIAKSFGFRNNPLTHLEVRPIPPQYLSVTDPREHPMNSYKCVNPIPFFKTPDLSYFQQQLENLGGLSHFCTGNMTNQPIIHIGGPRRSDPCTNST